MILIFLYPLGLMARGDGKGRASVHGVSARDTLETRVRSHCHWNLLLLLLLGLKGGT